MKKLLLFVIFTGFCWGTAVSQTTATTTSTWYAEAPQNGIHCYRIATLQPNTNLSSSDSLHLVVTLNFSEQSYNNTWVDATFANRSAFHFLYNVRGSGTSPGARLVAYQDSNAAVEIYLILNAIYGSVEYSVLENVEESVDPSPTDLGSATPPGTLVFDTSNPTAYPPSYYADWVNQVIPGTPNGSIYFAPLGVNGTHITQSTGSLFIGGPQQPNAILTFADGTTQSTAANPLITQSNGVTTIGSGGTGGAGFQFSAEGQTIGGVFGEGGNMMLQADAVTDTAHTGGLLFLGGNARGDGLAGKVFMTGDQNPSVQASTSALMLNASNNVGIGLSPYSNPASRLEVNGNITLTQGSGADMKFQDGTVQATAWNGVLQGGDYAESVDVTGNRSEYQPGDVLVVDANAEGRFVKSSTAYSTAVMGIYSTHPGVVGRRQRSDRSHMAEEVPMAMIGVVPTKVTCEGGSIKPGDLMVTSSKPGYAMKGTDHSQMMGAIIGKALGHLDSGTGLIEVAVSLQ